MSTCKANYSAAALVRHWAQGQLTLTPLRYAAMVSLLNLLLYNGPLYLFASHELTLLSSTGIQVVLALTVMVLALTMAIVLATLTVSSWLVRGLCISLPLLNALALYFITEYQVVLDRTMMGNLFNTNTREATEYFTFTMVLFWLALGVLPALIISRVRVQRSSRLKTTGWALATVTVMLISLYALSGSWLWFDKHASKLGGRVLPWSWIANSIRYQRSTADNREVELLPAAQHLHRDKTVVVLVIGETARAKNFSLYGYERETDAQLKARGAIALANTRACTTYTTGSLRCMLSHTDDSGLSQRSEPLPSYLHRQGIEVIWRTNNWGEPPLNVTEFQRSGDLRSDCVGDECHHDGVLLTGLKERIEASKKDKILVVLHQKGSHGPAYSARYPERFERFTPVCRSVELDQCSKAALLNAYDNTLLYTDDLLARVIDMLKAIGDNSLMLYISDHGESLGEYGLYLHGAPYAIAPDVQKDIPFVIWLSEAFTRRERLSLSALRSQPSHNHHQLFHSLMGALGIRSKIYRPDRDIFATARHQ